MSETEFYVVAFESTSHAIKMEKVMQAEFHIEMIPTPTEITHSCGLSFRIYTGAVQRAIEILESAGFPFGLYALSLEKVAGKRAIRLVASNKDGC